MRGEGLVDVFGFIRWRLGMWECGVVRMGSYVRLIHLATLVLSGFVNLSFCMDKQITNTVLEYASILVFSANKLPTTVYSCAEDYFLFVMLCLFCVAGT